MTEHACTHENMVYAYTYLKKYVPPFDLFLLACGYINYLPRYNMTLLIRVKFYLISKVSC